MLSRQVRRSAARKLAMAEFNNLKHIMPRRGRRLLGKIYGNAAATSKFEGHPMVERVRTLLKKVNDGSPVSV